MSDLPSGNGQAATNEIAGTREERWLLAQRIAGSRLFAKAPQLRDILLYLVGRAMEEIPPAAIGEYEIACNVLGRRPDFDANQDNIVRVQIRHLRKKLEEYFAGEGSTEPCVLTIPKGAYLPHFETREFPSAPEVSLALETAPVEAPPLPPPPLPVRRARVAWIVIGVLSVLVIALSAATLILWLRSESRARAVAAEPGPAWTADPLWPKIFAPGQQPSIVIADSCRSAMQDILDVDLHLPEFGDGSFPAARIDAVRDPKLQSALRLIASRQYTSMADLAVAARILELSRNYNSRPLVRYSRIFDGRAFKEGNFILIGSRRSIPWIELFEPQLNFAFEQDPESRKYQFRNKDPRPGEQTVYRISAADTYGDIAIVPNLSGNGVVLILSGIDMAATEAIGEMAVSRGFSAVLARMLAEQPASPYLEVLVEAKAMAGTARNPRIVASRLLRRPAP